MASLYRILQITRKELLELWRKAGVVAFILAIPVAEMIILGYATTSRIVDLPAAVVDADHSGTSRRLTRAIHQSQGFEVTESVETIAQAEQLLNTGQVSAFFVLPQGLEQTLNGRSGEAIAAVVDGSNTAIAGYTALYAEGVVNHFVTTALPGSQDSPVRAESRIWYNQELRRENFYIPGLLGTMLSLVILSITAICIVREREQGTLEQLMVSPIRPLELILGKLLPALLIAYAEWVIMLLIATQIFYVPVRGSLVLYAGLTLIYLWAEMGIGILISTLATSQAQALPTIFLLVTMSSILAGFITPVETMPRAAQQISALVPLSYFTTISRELLIKGAGLAELASQLLPLAGMSIGFFATSTLLLRRRLV